jgi:dienelactone hydrolase
MWKADSWLEAQYGEAVRAHEAARRTQSPEERRNGLIRALRESLGEFAPNPDFEPTLLERVPCDGYIRERVELSATPGLSFAAYVLIPDGADGPVPGVLALHGHGYGSREIVGLKPDGSPDTGKPTAHRHFALQLVRRGLAVIAPDVVGFGERRLDADLRGNPDAPNSCYRLATQLMMLGKTLTGLRVAEARHALDYLLKRPEVRGRKVGAMGFSGGALIAGAAAALDGRIAAAVLTGFPNTFKDSIFAVHHCIDNYTPGLLLHAELPELIALAAPRPLFLEAGERDPIFPREGFLKAAEAVRRAYERYGFPDRLAVDLFPGAHEVCGRKAYDWLREALLAD